MVAVKDMQHQVQHSYKTPNSNNPKQHRLLSQSWTSLRSAIFVVSLRAFTTKTATLRSAAVAGRYAISDLALKRRRNEAL